MILFLPASVIAISFCPNPPRPPAPTWAPYVFTRKKVFVSLRRAKADRRRVPSRSELQRELTEVAQHRAAISEVLRVIASSPHDLQPIFDTIIDSATRLCRADIGGFRLYEREGF